MKKGHREKIVSNALEFSEAVSKNSKVQIILMNDEDFSKCHEDLELSTVFEEFEKF